MDIVQHISECIMYAAHTLRTILFGGSCLMDIGTIVAFLGVLFAGLAWWYVRKTVCLQAITDLYKEYKSPEMSYAVRILWMLYKKVHNEDSTKLADAYMKIYKEDDKKILAGLRPGKACAQQDVEDALHCQRRQVSHFYQHLAALYVNKILPKRYIYTRWSRSGLEILPNIIIPIEDAMRTERGEKKLDEHQDPLWRLYNDAPRPL